MAEDGYLLDNAVSAAGSRFAAMSELFDPWTFAHLAAAGLRAGWRCWEVGAGGANVPSWLAAQVGSSGLRAGHRYRPVVAAAVAVL